MATHLEHLQTAKPKRDPKFREDVLRVYGYRCVICGFDFRLDNAPLAVDAAHIRWHQAHGPNIVSNGLALCALHHKLFDRGAFSLSETLKVQVSIRVNGSLGHMDYLTRFNSLSIAQPHIMEVKPDVRFVHWRREEVFRWYLGYWVDLRMPGSYGTQTAEKVEHGVRDRQPGMDLILCEKPKVGGVFAIA